jgi:hypothetical protein
MMKRQELPTCIYVWLLCKQVWAKTLVVHFSGTITPFIILKKDSMCVFWVLEITLWCGLQNLQNKIQMCIDNQIFELIFVLICSNGNQHHAWISSNGFGTVIQTQDIDFFTIICHNFKPNYNILNYTQSWWGAMVWNDYKLMV